MPKLTDSKKKQKICFDVDLDFTDLAFSKFILITFLKNMISIYKLITITDITGPIN